MGWKRTRRETLILLRRGLDQSEGRNAQIAPRGVVPAPVAPCINGVITPAVSSFAHPRPIVADDAQTFRLLRTAAAYAIFVLLPAAALFWVIHAGRGLPAPINGPVIKAA